MGNRTTLHGGMAAIGGCALVLWLFCGLGCGEGEDAPTPAAPEFTWHQDVQPLFEAHCNSCHRDGGIAPFSFTSPDQVRGVASLIAPSIQSRRMPPFLAAPAVRPLAFDNSLSDTQIETIVTWIDAGMPEGDPEQPGEPLDVPVSELSRRDLQIGMGQSYTPSIAPDEYRCFVLEWPQAELVYITGYEIEPGNLAIDHHAALFLIDPELASLVDTASGVDGRGEGYSCFGSAAPPGHEGIPNKLLGAWTPGSGGLDFPEGTGIRVEPGSRVVLQMHYSTEATGPQPDQTRVHFRVDGEIPDNAAYLPWLDIAWPSDPQTMRIPAGDASVVHEFIGDPTQSPLYGEFAAGVDPSEGVFVHGVLPHMHKLGTAFWLQIERADGSEERILEIGRWDFDWQNFYVFADPILVEPGDQLRLHCEFNNSAANQPVEDGVRREPTDVFWGEGSSDEMCTASIYVHGLAQPSTECPGSQSASTGQFEVTFDTQDSLRTSDNLDGEFVGPVSGSIFRDEDVTLVGPKEGAEPVAGFDFDRIDLRDGPDGPYLIDAVLPAGEYQFLGFMDTDGNVEAADGPDLNDPIMIPSRASVLQCEVQRVVVSFPLLLPQL